MTNLKTCSPIGIALFIIAIFVFTGLFYLLAGMWCILLGPLFALFSSRPVMGGDRWLWEKKR
jgi:hypothetical protein